MSKLISHPGPPPEVVDEDTRSAVVDAIGWTLLSPTYPVRSTSDGLAIKVSDADVSRLAAAADRVVPVIDASYPVRRAALVDSGEVSIAEAFEDEGGDRWFVVGAHISPEAMVLGVVVSTAATVGPVEAIELLVGVAGDGDPVALANEVLTRVTHRWCSLLNDEYFDFVERDAPGAVPVTVLAL